MVGVVIQNTKAGGVYHNIIIILWATLIDDYPLTTINVLIA